MEKNGESDSNFMAVDPVSPASSNSKEVSDEPAAPRRNSIDDNDPTRPRKRLAAMLIHDNADNTKQALPAKDKVPYGESENEPRQSDQAMEHKNHNGTTSKPDKASLEDGTFSTPVAVKGIGNKVTIHLRTTRLPDTKEDGFEEPTIDDDENDGLSQLTPTSSGPPRSVGSLQGESPNGSLCSPEIEVEEVEDMEEDEDLAGQIADVDQYINSPIITGGSAVIKNVMDEVTSKLERDPIPLRQLEELAHTMSSFVNVVGDQIDSFYKLYLVNQDVWPNLPNMMEALLKRSEPFGQSYFRRVDKSTPGLEAIILALVEFARLTALFLRYDAWSLEHALPDRDTTLLSWGYQRTLSIIMRPNQLSSLMQRVYNFNMVTILPRVMRAFIDTHDGLGTLRKYDELILQRIPLQPKLLFYASLPLEIYAKLIRCLEVVIKECAMSEDLAEIQIAVSDGAFMAMTSVENLLAGLFETHLQLLIIKDFNVVLNTLCSLLTAFYGMSSAEARIRKLIEEKIGNEYGVIEAYEYPSLAEWSCRFPFLFKMLTSNRMDFRLQGLVKATELLVSAWRDSYGNGTDWHDSVLLRFLAHFIIENKIVEYIMGPESHHELIRRSANITGFLIVTNTTTVDIRHALWQPVVNNKDPRIVQATLAMHQEMIGNMSIPLLVELSKRIKDIPFSSFDAHMMELVSRLLETIRTNFYQQQVVHLDPPPYEMLIQLIRMASREEENTTPSGGLPPSTIFEFAGKELMALAEYGPAGELRRKIYLDCISDIKQMTSSATGSINVIQAFLQQRPRNVRPGSPGYVEDIEFLIKNLNLAELLVNEIARFVDSHSKHDQYSTLRRLKARLELLQFILYNSPECLTAHLGEKLWTYLVGAKALGTSERDDGFEFYINHYLKITAACVTNAPPQAHVSLTDQQQADPILESVFKTYFPALDPACFSPNVLPFCMKSIEYLNKPTGLEDNFEEDHVNFEGVEQLWRIILKAPDDRLAAEATSYFMNLYLDARPVCSKPAKVIENTHFMIVERCINQLTSTASNIDNTVPTVNSRDENAMFLDTFHGNSDTQEFFRSLDLLDHFVKGYKSRPKYNQGFQEANQSSAVDMITGVPLTLRLRWHASNFQSPIQSFQIGNLDTGQDLHDRIAKIVGGDKYRLIISGKEFKPLHEPLKTLKDFCIPDNSVLIVQKSPDQGTVTVSSSVPSNLNALQIEIMRHFDSLFELLSLPEPQATKIWFFLRNFPVDEHIKSSMISGPSWSETFPADYPYKTLYSLHALRTCFEEQRQQQNSDEKSTFINEATSSLLKTLMNNNHESKESYAMKTRAQVTNEILDCLRLFLQESITECGFSPSFPSPDDFVERIFEILRVCSQKEYSQCPGSESCVANAFNVLLIASKIDSEVWSSLTQKSELIHHVNRFLLKDKRQTVRLGTGEAIIATLNRYLSTIKPTSHDFARFFWSILKDMLDQPWLDPKSSAEMFQTALLNFKFLSEVSPESLDIETCFKTWSSRLIKYEVNEVVGCSNEDFVITGFTRLLTRCVSLARSRGIRVYNDVAEDIFQNLLFRPMTTYTEDSQLIESLPCLHGPSRSEIYTLVIQLVNDPENCVKMVKHNLHLFPKDQSLHDGFHADRGRWARSVAGHVGLQNMSNTCYLNSLMTQLFMNRTFRAFILEMPIDQADESQKLIHFLKVLFARMQNSYTKAVEPKDFVEAITDYEGEQIDIAVQMDVDEFFNLIFDRLEGQMPSMELKSSFRSHYGGQLVQQVKSNECPHISERTEPFSAIQCDIKGKSTLQESLKAYVEGEIMDGDNKYSCTTCDRHVDAVKRTCLKDIPNHLIFHLKRFEFDLQTMHRSKINDSFEFPTSIDMKPYTIEYLSGDEKNGENSSRDMFELVGVLVHSGTAESGHYYSYIRNRPSPSGAPEWFEFNDSEVSAFDPSTIPAACYGGTDGVTRDAMGQTYALSKPYSAYMLFYERSSLLSPSTVNQDSVVQTRLSIPRELELEIHSENEYFIRKYCMFDNNHIEFIRKLLDQQQRLFKNSTPYDHIHEKRALILGLDTLEQIATRFKDSTGGEALFNILNTYLINCPECCLEFFDWLCQKEDAITNLLVCNPYGKARANFLRLVMFALNQVRRKRPEAYGPIDESGDHDIEYEDTVLYKLCTSLMRSWNGLQWSIKTWGDYFGLLASISALGETEKVVMLDMGFLKKIMELLLMDHLQAPRKMEYLFENFAKIWAKRRPSLGNLGSVMGELMSLCDPHLRPCRDDENRTNFRHLSKFPLNVTEYDYFSFSAKSQMQILSRLLESQTTTESMARLVANIVKSEVAPAEGPLLEQIKNTLLAGVPVDPAQEAEPFLMCLLYFVSVTKSPNYVREIIRRVSDEVPTIGTDGGSEHLLFFQELAVLKNLHLKPYLIKWRMIDYVAHWAPPLLTYCEATVRESTEKLLDDILFDSLQDGDRPRARKGVEDLMNGCFMFIESKLPRSRQPCDEKTFENVLRVLEKCGEYQDDEETFRARNNALRLLIEKIILEEEEDADLASDEWGGSEIGSDTHEMEVQLDEYNST